jgi:hypothetical protein
MILGDSYDFPDIGSGVLTEGEESGMPLMYAANRPVHLDFIESSRRWR